LIEKAGEQAKRAWIIMHRLRKLLQHRDAEFGVGDLRHALGEAVELATLGAAQHGISILVDVPDEPVFVRMDSIQLQILLANLIRNAVDELRVSRGERKIWISLRRVEGEQAEILVEDTGPGIAPDVYANIFDPFLTTKPHGLGVGLAVSRRIALAHEGRLAARNRPDGGAAFSFLVPMMKS
jgi:two-component system, LuxR family, sensor kinase FixL